MAIWKSYNCNVVGSYVGNYPAVGIHNFNLAKELLNKDEWCGRAVNIITRYLRADNGANKVCGKMCFQNSYIFIQGIITTDGQAWVEQRRFAMKHLKDFGVGKVGLQGVIQGEVEDLVKHLSKVENQDFK